MRLLILLGLVAGQLFAQDMYRPVIGRNGTGTATGSILFRGLDGAVHGNVDLAGAGVLNLGTGAPGDRSGMLQLGAIRAGTTATGSVLPIIGASSGGFDNTHDYSPFTALLGAGATSFSTVFSYLSPVAVKQESGYNCAVDSSVADSNWQTGCFYGVIVNRSTYTGGAGHAVVGHSLAIINNTVGGVNFGGNYILKDYIHDDDTTHKKGILKGIEFDNEVGDHETELGVLAMHTEFRGDTTVTDHGNQRGISFDQITGNNGYFDQAIWLNDFTANIGLHLGRQPSHLGSGSSILEFSSIASNLSKIYQTSAGALKIDNGGGSLSVDASGNVSATSLTSGNVCSDGSGKLFTPGCTGGGANALPVDSTHPLYLYAHFADTDENTLRLSYSRDAVNWTPVSRTGIFDPGHSFRDPSIVYWNGQFCVIATPDAGLAVQYRCSADLVTWTGGTISNLCTLPGGVTPCAVGVTSAIGTDKTTLWAPEFDKNTGSLGFWVSASSTPFAGPNNTPGSFFACWVPFDPTVSPLAGGASCFYPSGSSQGRTFDYFPWYNSATGTYYLFYVDQQPVSTGNYGYGGGTVAGVGTAVVQPIAYATSTSHHGGTYTQQTTPGSSWVIGGGQTEGPSLFKTGTGALAAVIDTWVYPPQGGRHYTPYVSIATSSTISPSMSWSVQTTMNIARAEHGTVYAITDQSVANIVYKAESAFNTHFSVGWGGFGINFKGGPASVSAPAPYPLTVRAGLAPSGGIMYPEPATLGLDTGSPATEIGTLTAIGEWAQSGWTDTPGKARLVHNYLGTGNYGQFGFVNATQNGSGETSVMFCDGCAPVTNTDIATYTNTGCTPGTVTSPGLARPGVGSCPVSSRGDRAIWTFGVNNQAIDSGNDNQILFAYAKGLVNRNFSGTIVSRGGFPFQIDPDNGGVRLNYGLVLGGGGPTAYGHDRYAQIFSRGANVIEMGDSSGSIFANHNAIVKMGSSVVEYNNTTSTSVNSIISGLCTSAYCSQRNLGFQTNGTWRWNISVRSPENGSNTGSDLFFDRLDDAGNPLGTPFFIDRGSGKVIFDGGMLFLNFPPTASGSKALCFTGPPFYQVTISAYSYCF